jgi:Ca2+:H+ antiporter
MGTHTTSSWLPFWSWFGPIGAAAVLTASFAVEAVAAHPLWQMIAIISLAVAVFAAVHHAEVLAVRFGEPLGSLVLALAITIIELGLIISFLFTYTPGAEFVARDTIYATVMIVLNGVVGLCLIAGGRRHYEQVFRRHGVSSALAVLGTLAIFTLIFPNYTTSAAGPYYSTNHLLFIAVIVLALYAVFVFVQTLRHRDYFLELSDADADAGAQISIPSNRVSLLSAILLLVSLLCVVFLAKGLSLPISHLLQVAGLPTSFLGVIIALIVLMPESVASLRAAMRNKLQISLNLALGSAIATIGLTVPIVSFVMLLNDRNLPLGLEPLNVVLLLSTLFISTLTLSTGRTTVLHGAVHLVIFAVFLLVSAFP